MVRHTKWIGAIELVIFGYLPLSAAPLLRAAVVDANVYVSPLGKNRSDDLSGRENGGHFTLLTVRFVQDDPPITLQHPDVVETDQFRQVLNRWQVDRKRVHFVCYDQLETANIAPVERGIILRSSPLGTVSRLTQAIGSTMRDSALLKELESGRSDQIIALMKVPKSPVTVFNEHRFSFDFLPGVDGQYEWYFSEPDGDRNRVTRWDSKQPTKKSDQTKWLEVGVWTTDFGGRFFAASGGDDRYFVTDTGRVFAAPRKAKAGTPLREIWKGKPVDALIHDSDSSKWYGFTKDQYFEIADPIKPVAHTLTIKRSSIAEDALKTAATCGRLIRGIPEPKGK